MQGKVKASELGEDADVPDEDAAESSEEENETEDVTDYDTDEERRRYELEQEEALEEAYAGYLQRQGKRDDEIAKKRARLEKPGDILSAPTTAQHPSSLLRDPATFKEEPESGGGLLVDDGSKKCSPAELAKDWYSQDIFKEFGGLINPDELPSRKRLKAAELPNDSSSDEGDDDEVEQEVAEDDSSDDDKPTEGTTSKGGLAGLKDDEFEVVPQDASDSDASSASDIEEPGAQEAAEIRAVAKAMLKGRTKNDMIEDGYHRFAFHDTHLPRWFAEDERRHMRPPVLVSKDEIEAEKERMRAIDARPLKKVAEAKARKRKRLQVRIDQAKTKANSIMEQGDLSERGKAKEVAALMAKAKSGSKSKKKPSRNDKFKKKGPPLDKRLYSDKRQVDNKKKKAAAKARKKKSGKGKSKR